MSDVFILGAGFSKAISPHMPVLTELSQDVSAGLVKQPDTKVLSESLFAQLPNEIELWMTYLAQSHPWLSEAENLRNRAAFLDMVVEINKQLSIKIGCTLNEPCPDWLVRLVTNWHETQAPVITLNYDTLIERCAGGVCEKKAYCRDFYALPFTPLLMRTLGVGDGYAQKTFTLHKLHGSINWLYSGATDPTGETIYYANVSDWKSQSPEGVEGRSGTDKVPFIVPPLSEKGPFFQHETVRTMWRQAGDAVQSANRVFILGYSLPQTDLTMRYFLTDKARAGQQIFFLVNTDSRMHQHFQSSLENHFDINGDFICDEDPIPKFVDAYVSGKL